MKILTDMLHLLLCQKIHESDMMQISSRTEGRCYYYLEDDISGGEEMPDHTSWLKAVEIFKKSLEFSTDEQALEFIKECLAISQQIRELVNGHRGKKDFLMTLFV